MWMTDYIREIQRQFVAHYSFAERPDEPGVPVEVPDGEYPMMIGGRLDRVRIQSGKISCCNFDPVTEAERELAARFDDECLPHGTMGTGRGAARSRARSWRCTGYSWFWSNDREDFGSVILRAGRYVATTARGSAEFEVLGDAKDFVEKHSS